MTQDELKALLDYEPETGDFFWKKKVNPRVRMGEPAGCDRGGAHNYRVIRVMNKMHYAHRLAFLWMTGAWPEHEVDHIDGVTLNNRWANLRDIPHFENNHNIGKPPRHNTSGLLGVCFDKNRQTWNATIRKHGKTINLGRFNTPEEAHAAYLRAKDELHPTHQRLR